MTRNEPGHIIPKATVIRTYIGLLVLAAIMIGLSRIPVQNALPAGLQPWIDLHWVRTAVVMAIAVVMGIITAAVLMGLKYDGHYLNLLVFVSNFIFLLIFVLFTWVDTSFRGVLDPAFTEKINFTSPVHAGAGEHGK